MPTATPDLMALVEELARFSANPPALTRVYSSPEQKARRLSGLDVNAMGGHVRQYRCRGQHYPPLRRAHARSASA